MIRTIALVMLCLVANFGCQSYIDGTTRTAGEFTDDAQIAAMVKLKLWDDPEVKGWRIKVSSVRAIVTLEGRVPSEYARDKAIRIAKETGSVVGVEDRLSIVN